MGLNLLKKTVAILLLFLTPAAVAATPPNPHNDPELDGRIREGVELSYDLRFTESEERFAWIIERYPEHPMGYFFLGMTYWSRFIVDYEDQASYNRCHELLDRAIELGREMVSASGPEAQLYFYLGGAEGFKGQIVLKQGQFLSAYLHGRRGKKHLERALELDPDLVDAKLGLGIYHYYAATLPRFIRFFARILRMGGDRELGLAELHEVLEKGRYTVHHARMVLQIVYADYEEDNQRALELIQTNRRLFPRNHWYDFYLEKVLINMGEYARAIPMQEQFILACRMDRTYFKREWIPHITFRQAVCRFRLGDLEKSREQFRRIIDESPDFPEWLVSWSRVQLGMIADLEGDVRLAARHYQAVLADPDRADSHVWAREFTRRPYGEGDEREYPLFFWNIDPNNYWGYVNRN